ncbi:SPOR domain-containing protein [Sphingomonas sp. KC8]|uniref:SPOR domain-containing protein n=1 Tax=Sphingomonas sp. KC8 TaxID=1030157 RepID=UPI0002489C4A|nr:SPOR domain-containing protein [Sphingomonas sp. KC8]ARS27441.1 sporulation domain-containing protein [Sphingomonas sp. KC8]
MTDAERGRFGLADEDRLPWLEAVEDEDDHGGVGASKLIAAVIAALVFIGLVVGGVFWMRERNKPAGSGELITAPEGDYKVPAEGAAANGMAVAGEGDAAYAASEGQTVESVINPNVRPEVPVAGVSAGIDVAPVRTVPLPPSQGAQASTTPAAKPAAKPAPVAAKPAPEKAAPAKPAGAPANLLPETRAQTAMAGGTIQLGAFNSESIATGEWSKLAAKFPELGKLSRSITTVEVGGKTLYRLRASGIGAREACKALKAANKPCNAV